MGCKSFPGDRKHRARKCRKEIKSCGHVLFLTSADAENREIDVESFFKRQVVYC